jgi:hypothetical protein
MADKYIRDLTAASELNDTDVFVLDQGGDAVKLTGAQLKAWVKTWGGGGAPQKVYRWECLSTAGAPGSGTSVPPGYFSMDSNAAGTQDAPSRSVVRLGVPVTSGAGSFMGAGSISYLNNQILGAPRVGDYVEARVMVPVLSTATDRFQCGIGSATGKTTVSTFNGARIGYVDNVNSGAWFCETRGSGSISTLNSAVTVVANTWYVLKCIYSAANNWDFYIDGTLIGPLTTNLPTLFQPNSWIIRPSTATVASYFHVDYLEYGMASP